MQLRRSARVADPPTATPAPKKPRKAAKATPDTAIESTNPPPAAAAAPHPRICCLKACSQPLTQDQNLVEVRSGDRPPSDSKAIWGAAGRANFHENCWQVLLRAIAPRYKGPDQLSVAERRCVKEAAARAEHYDTAKVMVEKAALFAEKLQKSKHAVIFTGAGVSTAAGIGDYRGLTGAWTLQELAFVPLLSEYNKCFSPKEGEVIDAGVPYETLRPTYTHEAIVKLIEMGLIKYVISQNCDGLHLMSGVPEMCISELHGNVFKEFCIKCRKSYVRPFYVMDDSDESDNCTYCHFNHLTGRKCTETPSCKGALSDTIINFGDNLDEDTLTKAEMNAKLSDLFISLGSTMLVTPAATLIERASGSVICNRQKTAYDDAAVVRAYGDCDKFFKFAMQKLLGEEQESAWNSALGKKRGAYNKLRRE